MAKKAEPRAARKSGPKKGKGSPDAAPFFRPFAGLKAAKAPKPTEPERAAAEPVRKAPPATPPNCPETVSDAESFARYMAGVKKLEGEAVRVPRSQRQVEPRTEPERVTEDPDAAARERLSSLVVEGLRFETSDDGERLEGRRLDCDPREVRRLRRGQRSIDARIDLHGMRLEQARAEVETFVRKRRDDGERVLAIVHGKGAHSPRGQAVLRGEIAAWLSQGNAARHVMAFATAPDELGGTGVTLVLLAR